MRCFYIANADGVLHPAELDYLGRVARIFGLDETTFGRIRANHESDRKTDPYAVLGVDRDAGRRGGARGMAQADAGKPPRPA